MTKQTMESLEASGFDGMIQEGPDAFDGYDGAPPCFVHHRYAGGWCERPGGCGSTASASASSTARRSRPG